VRRHWVFQGVLALFPIKLSSYYSTSHCYVLCIRWHGANMSQKPTFGCVMSVPSATRFCTVSPTCRPTCCRHVGPNILCLTFWNSGQHADIQHIPTKPAPPPWPPPPCSKPFGPKPEIQHDRRGRGMLTLTWEKQLLEKVIKGVVVVPKRKLWDLKWVYKRSIPEHAIRSCSVLWQFQDYDLKIRSWLSLLY
jgi:hypothetical protein